MFDYHRHHSGTNGRRSLTLCACAALDADNQTTPRLPADGWMTVNLRLSALFFFAAKLVHHKSHISYRRHQIIFPQIRDNVSFSAARISIHCALSLMAPLLPSERPLPSHAAPFFLMAPFSSTHGAPSFHFIMCITSILICVCQ